MLSSQLILCRPLLLLPPIPPSIRVFSNESALRMRWSKDWSFSFSIIPSKEIPGLRWQVFFPFLDSLRGSSACQWLRLQLLMIVTSFVYWYSRQYSTYQGFPGGASGKQPACRGRRWKRCRFSPWAGKIPWRRAWQTAPVFLPGEFYWQRSLAISLTWLKQLSTHARTNISIR